MFINQAKQNLIKPCLLNLSFIPLTNKNEANNKASQKIQLTSDDINRGYVNVEFKLPLRFLGEWEGIERTKSRVESKEILEMYFSYGKEMIKLEGKNTRFTKDLNLHLATQAYNKGDLINIELKHNNQTFNMQATIDENGKSIIKNVFND
ncbi:hypothetical protein [Campylobacter troglodytis]|uniref:hypothetical protein n=1 Tax=Campylobacter troglodytis TaxID=654363 RepID=UPI0011588230|nr:hypothetical protein [Campylobacter troglodytis]TQR58135.1 hypothetical protein DMC01_08090 [Campylobacter troglodytis]